jgi:hypothetical protein
MDLGNIQGTFREYSGNIWGTSRERVGTCGCIRGKTFGDQHSGNNIQGTKFREQNSGNNIQ